MASLLQFIFAPLNNLVENLAQQLGLPFYSTKGAFTIFLCFPLGLLYGTILQPKYASKNMRHIVTASLGLCVLYFIFEIDSSLIMIQPLLMYLCMCLLHPSNVHIFTFIFSMAYLAYIHVRRMMQHSIVDDYDVDISGPVMMMTIKITYVGCYIHDSWKADQDQETHGNHENIEQESDKAEIYKLKKDDRSSYVPDLLEYFGYVFHFASVAAGPPSNFQDYQAFIKGTNFPERSKPQPLSFIKPALKKLVMSVICLLLHVKMKPIFHEKVLTQTDFMSQYSMPSRLLYAYLICIIVKFRYLFVFILSDANNNLCGLGFNGYDELGTARWDLISNFHMFNYEFAPNFKILLDSWNISAAKWLKSVVYERATVMPLLATHLTSAVWHGFYPGYYLSFLSLGFVVPVARLARKRLRPYFLDSKEKKVMYDIAGWAATRVMLVYIIIPFVLLDVKRGLLFWKSFHYIGHIVCIVGILILNLIPLCKKPETPFANGINETKKDASVKDDNANLVKEK